MTSPPTEAFQLLKVADQKLEVDRAVSPLPTSPDPQTGEAAPPHLVKEEKEAPSTCEPPRPSPNLDELTFHPDYAKPLVGHNDHIIIRAGDDTHFYHSLSLLAEKSSLFKDLLSVPRPDSTAIEILPCDNLSSRGFATVLQTLFDPHELQLTEVSDLVATVHSALKDADAYCFDDFRTALAPYIRGLRLYDKSAHFALAVAFGLDDMTRRLSLEVLLLPLSWSLNDSACQDLLRWCQSDRWDDLLTFWRRHHEQLSRLEDDLIWYRTMLNGFDDFGQRCKPSFGRTGCAAAVRFQGEFRHLRRAAARDL